MADEEQKKKGREPVGTASLKLSDLSYQPIGGIFFGHGSRGGYAVIGVKDEVTLPAGSAVFLHFNVKNYKLAFIKRGAIIGV